MSDKVISGDSVSPDWTTKTVVELIDCIRELEPQDLNKDLVEWCNLAGEKRSHSEKILILFAIYQRLTSSSQPQWCALPLVRLSKAFLDKGCTWLSKYYGMLSLCDEARSQGGPLGLPHDSYRLMLGFHDLSEHEIQRYVNEAIRIYSKLPEGLKPFPEAILSNFDQDWKTGVPSTSEYGLYYANGTLIKSILQAIESIKDKLKEIKKAKDNKTYSKESNEPTTKQQGDLLELLGRYVMSCMPGARINESPVWQYRTDTDYDVVCSLDGFQIDFRTEFGRYFICECKAWTDSVDFDVVAKFGRVLDSVRAKFGIIISLNGLTGDENGENAGAEQLHIFRDRGIIIVSLNKDDLLSVAEGRNFINMIRQKYDDIRLFKRPAKQIK